MTSPKERLSSVEKRMNPFKKERKSEDISGKIRGMRSAVIARWTENTQDSNDGDFDVAQFKTDQQRIKNYSLKLSRKVSKIS